MAVAARRLYPVMAVLGISGLVASGCTSDKSPSESTPDAPVSAPLKAADTVPVTGSPVSVEMRRSLKRLSELMPAQKFEQLEARHRSWLEQREKHCEAAAGLSSNEEESLRTIVKCRRDSDIPVMERLRGRHLALLRAANPPSIPAGIDTQIDSADAPVPVLAMLANEDLGRLFVAGERSVYSLDALQGHTRWRAGAAKGANTRIALSPNKTIVASSSKDDELLRLWDAQSGDFLSEYDIKGKDAPFAFLEDGRHIVVGARRLLVIDLETGVKQTVLAGPGNASAIAVAGNHVIVGSKSAQLVSFTVSYAGDGIELEPEGRATASVPGRPVTGLFPSPDGATLTSVTVSGAISQWTVPELNHVSSVHSELKYVGSAIGSRGGDLLFLSGNNGNRAARGEVLAVDLAAGLTKTLYENARTNAPIIALADAAATLFIADANKLASIRVGTDTAGFYNMESLAEGALANLQSPDEALAELLGVSGRRQASTLGELSDDTKVHVVGVYEGELPDGRRRGFREHATGNVVVNVGGSGRAVLVLTAYEPVEWTVIPRGVFVDHILLFGYHDQTVNAPPGAHVYTNLQSASSGASVFAYKKDGNYTRLERAVREITGKDVDTFQGKYRAGRFSVNSGGLAPKGPDVPGIEKWVDEDGVVNYGDRR